MHLSIGLTTSISANRMKWIYENADNLCLNGLWIGEDIGRPQEIFTSTALLLLNTKNVNIEVSGRSWCTVPVRSKANKNEFTIITLINGRFKMKVNSIYKYVLAIALFAVAALMNGCHGVNW